jgi:hypothetical protein
LRALRIAADQLQHTGAEFVHRPNAEKDRLLVGGQRAVQ